MKRVSKDPQERRSEIVDVAEKLFAERGFDATAVSDIVKAVNVAQGTFYCYFKSKRDVLQAVAEKTIAQFLLEVRQIVDRPGADAARQLSDVVNLIFRLSPEERKLVEHLHHDSNVLLQQKVMQETVARLHPLLLHILNAGVAQGRFQVSHPAEMNGLLMGAMVFLFHGPGFRAGPEEARRHRISLEQVLTRALCAEEGSIRLKW
jgi:AcrR family transcriptional regulator